MVKFTTAIIAGGKSSRMGRDKALLPIRGKTMVERIVEQAAPLGGQPLLITNKPEDYAFIGIPMFSDLLPDKGALGGLYTAIECAAQPYVLTLACDMPFVSQPLMRYLLSLATEFDAVVPRLGGEAEPFRSVYSKACAPFIRAALDAGKMRVISFFESVRVRWVDDGEIDPYDPLRRTFFNVNTPEELAMAEKLLREE